MAEVTPIDGLGRMILRGEGAALDAVGPAFGVPIPRTACRAEAAGPRAALWLGPDEFLLMCPERDLSAIRDVLVGSLAAHLHALVDVTHRQLALRISGPDAATLLNTGCPLDLHLDAFPIDSCTRTILGKAEITLWRRSADVFHLDVARSYLPYVRDFLAEARLGLA